MKRKNIPVRKIRNGGNTPISPDSFRIRRVEDLLADGDVTHELHRHDFYFILAIGSGEGVHTIDFVTHAVKHHSVFVVRPGQVHELYLKSGSTGYLMQFSREFYPPEDTASRQWLRRSTAASFCQMTPDTFGRLLVSLENMFREFTDRQENYDEVIRANLKIFFIHLVRNLNPQKPDDLSQHSQDRLEAFLDLLESHFAGRRQASDYAEMLNLSLYQLNMITKKLLSKTSSEIINEYTVLEAKRLLTASSRQVKEIAYLLGYDDVSYFIRFFKRHTGRSPEAFRQSFK